MTAHENDPLQFLETPQGRRIAYKGGAVAGRHTIVFLHGHGSDMEGTKARAVAEWAREAGYGMLRFDYSGHGQSSGEMMDGRIGLWLEDCLAVMDTLLTPAGESEAGRCVLVGSSLGGWLMMLVARARPERVAGLLGIAAAPDFTRELIWKPLDDSQKAAFRRDGKITFPNPYAAGEVVEYPHGLITEAEAHCILDKTTQLQCPVRLLHGMRDAEVPPAIAERLAAAISAPDCEVIYDNEGDHRFSNPPQIDLLLACLGEMMGKI